jgi:predicted transcriptional regulator
MKKNDELLLKMAHYCTEPRLITAIAKHVGASESGTYKLLQKLVKSGEIKKTRDTSACCQKFVYLTINPEQLPPLTQKNSLKYKKDQKDQKDQKDKALAMVDKEYNVKDCIKVVGNTTIVKGLNGYHGGKVKRAEPRYYVGSSANLL